MALYNPSSNLGKTGITSSSSWDREAERPSSSWNWEVKIPLDEDKKALKGKPKREGAWSPKKARNKR